MESVSERALKRHGQIQGQNEWWEEEEERKRRRLTTCDHTSLAYLAGRKIESGTRNERVNKGDKNQFVLSLLVQQYSRSSQVTTGQMVREKVKKIFVPLATVPAAAAANSSRCTSLVPLNWMSCLNYPKIFFSEDTWLHFLHLIDQWRGNEQKPPRQMGKSTQVNPCVQLPIAGAKWQVIF